MTKFSLENGDSVTGLIPAAGRATRLGGLPYSKELLPIPARADERDRAGIRLAIENSVRLLLECGIRHQHIIIAPSKQDIPAHLGDGERLGASIVYTEIADSPSVPHSLDAAFDSVAGDDVVLVFPDIMFEPRAEIAEFFSTQTPSDIDILLALVPSTRGDKVDMVSLAGDGLVDEVVPKPGIGICGWTWVAAAWSAKFSKFLHEFLNEPGPDHVPAADSELYVADVINAAIKNGLVCQAGRFAGGTAIDIGTPGDFAAIWRQGFPGDAEHLKV